MYLSQVPKFIFRDLGSINYKKAFDFQKRLFNKVILEKKYRDPENYILFCHHPHVYSLGSRANLKHLLLPSYQLRKKKIMLCYSNRGGDITYHGPGQLVVYFIVDLDQFMQDIHQYIRLLEKIVIRTLAHFTISSDIIPGFTGIWTKKFDQWKKICAIGIRTSRWVSMHGLALNINTNLRYFENIVPCGIQNKGVTSMQQVLHKPIAISLVKKIMVQEIYKFFKNFR